MIQLNSILKIMTNKSYTDIPQSKTLSEILPYESADMYYFRQVDNDYFPPDVKSIYPIPLYKDGKENFNYDVPCWSLAALFDVLPKIQGFKPIIILYYNYIAYTHTRDLYTKADNLVDACYKMIIHLHELKML